jgi:hypothetical protein
MRIAGTFLLIAGFLLCLSIAWAAPGFLMMGFGLIFLQIAEGRKTPSAALDVSLSNESAPLREPSLLAAQKDDARLEVSSDQPAERIIRQRNSSRSPTPWETGLAPPYWKGKQINDKAQSAHISMTEKSGNHW